MERLSTGVKGLDELIGGGLKPGSINLIAGEPGCGKSVFSVHYIMAGAEAGETCLYVSVEEKRDKFYSNMEGFGFDMQKLEDEGKLIFHKTTVSEMRNLLDQGLISFEEYFKPHQIKRVVLDSVTALMLAYNAETAQRNALMVLFEAMEKWGATVLVTSEVESGAARFGVEYLVDTIIHLYYVKIGQERVRTLEVFKMRGTDHTKQEIVYRLGKGGMILYPNEKVLV
ncbi:MAG: AAA family ATPase [Candidatus Altiarchaeales archaeon]|nr:AAA family ATPase [Candidatus Altiarchaeales archaeon]MBD3416591.1 AAA family ATPase [Candidatus Altiarchaeales archaeon]